MPSWLSAATLAGALLLAAPGAAIATPLHGQRAEIAAALSTAESYWGATPCNGRIIATVDRSVPVGMAGGTDAWVTFGSSLGANDLEAPPSSFTACRVGIARWQWPTAAAIRSDWGMFCLTVVHEVGHLLGHPHSDVPGSVMAPVFTGEGSVPAICRRPVPTRRGSG